MTADKQLAAMGGAVLVVLSVLVVPVVPAVGAAGNETSERLGTDDWAVEGHDLAHTGANPDGTGPRYTLGHQWRYRGPSGSGSVAGAPTVVDGTIYAATNGGPGDDPRAVAVDTDGTEVWNTSLETTGDLFSQRPAVNTSAAVTGDRVYVAGTDADGFVIALDRSDGSPVWDQYVGARARAAPIVVDGTVYVGSAQGSDGTLGETFGPLTALDASDGSKRWHVDLDGTEVAGSPAYADGHVYVGTTGGSVYQVNVSDQNVTGHSLGSAVTTTPTVAGGAVFVGTADDTVHRLSTGDLSVTATRTVDGSIGGLAVHDGSVYVTTGSGTLVALDATTLEPRASEQFDGAIDDAPTVVDDTVYVRQADTVITRGLDLADRDEFSASYPPASSVVAANGTAYVGTSDGIGAVTQLCDPSVTGPDDGEATVEFPGHCGTLEAAVEAADHGETVSIGAGTHSGRENASVTVGKNLTVVGHDATLSAEDSPTDAYRGLTLADGTTLSGVTLADYRGPAVLVRNASDVTVTDVTVGRLPANTDSTAPRGVVVETRGGAAAGTVTLDGLTVDSDNRVIDGVLVRSHSGAATRSSLSEITIRDATVRNATTGVNVTAHGGADVTGVSIQRSTVSGSDYALRAYSGPNGTISGVDATGLTVDGGSGSTGIGVTAVAGGTTGTPATVERVTVSDSSIRDIAAGMVLNATTAGGSDALVTDVAVDNLTATNATGAGLEVISRDAGASSPSEAAVVREVNVSDSTLASNEQGLLVDADDGTHGAVSVETSSLSANVDGVLVTSTAAATNVSVTRSDIVDNVDYGVRNNGTGNVSAVENFWGDYSGPYDPVDDFNHNPNGTGDEVSANVLYEPWVDGTTAVADANRSAVAIGEAVEFHGDALTDDSTSITNWTWAFDDGTSATGQTVTHAFDAGGTYVVALTVEDDAGGNDTDTVTIDVADDEQPVADVEAPPVVRPGENATFDASGSSDNGEIAYYEWSFGDGTVTNGSDPTVTHSYATEGEMTVELTVGDTVGNENSTTTTLTVDGTPPNAELSANRTDVGIGDAVAFDASNSSDGEDEIAHYEWNFDGDETVDATTTVSTAEHTYDGAGEYDATVTVVDRAGNENDTVVPITVSDSTPPNAAFTVSPTSPEENETVTFDASNSSDNGEIAYYEWTFDDGTTANETNQTVTHTYETAGDYTVELTVVDTAGNGDSTTRTVNVTQSTSDDGNTSDGNTGDGNTSDGDTSDGDTSDGDTSDGDTSDGDTSGGDGSTGDSTGDTGGNGGTVGGGGGGSTQPAEPSSSISLTDASLSSNDVAVDEQVTVSATFENSGDADGDVTAELFVDGEATGASETVDVPAGETRNVTFDVSFVEAGDYTVAVNDHTVGTVGVRDPENVEDRSESTIDAGSASVSGETGVTSISFVAGGSGTISVTRLAELPDGVPAPEGVLLLPLRIQAPPDLADRSATVRFELERSTLAAADVAPEDVRLVRYHDGEWQQLDTSVVERSDQVVTYAADTPGFSLFAAVGHQETATEPETETETGADTGTATESESETETETSMETATAGPTESATPAAPGEEAGGGLGPDVAGLIAGIAILLLVGGVGYRRFADDEDVEPDVRV